MQDELVERLHKEAAFVNELAKAIVNAGPANPYAGKPFIITDAAIVMGEAADRVEAQAAEIARLREALREMLDAAQEQADDESGVMWRLACAMSQARAALSQGKD